MNVTASPRVPLAVLTTLIVVGSAWAGPVGRSGRIGRAPVPVQSLGPVEECLECAPCDLFQLINLLLTEPPVVPADHPCADAPPVADPEACCEHFLDLLPVLPGSPRLPTTHPCAPPCEQPCLSRDFEELLDGWIVTDQIPGVTVSGTRQVRAFDTGDVSCGDTDLGTPGTGTGNTTARGIVLVLAADTACQPNDSEDGGTLVLTFDEPSEVYSVGLLDIDEPGASVLAFDTAGNLLVEVMPRVLDDNSWQEVVLATCDVKTLELTLGGSGALSDIVCPAP